MKKVAFRLFAVACFFAVANAASLFAQDSSTDTITCQTNRSLLHRNGEVTLLKDSMTLGSGIQVFTNATFKVNDGKVRNLEEGQTLRSDGYMLNSDGTLVPVTDHIVMSNGRVVVFKDGEGTPITEPLKLPDGSIINPDGTYSRDVRSARLVDGQLLTLDGAPMARWDTITFNDNKVVVFKNGILIPLQSADVTMGMYDGTRVRGDGFLTFKDGTTGQMTNGQIMTVEGVRPNW